MPKRIVVIGGLAAGPSAASKAKRINPANDVVLLEQGEHISYGICEIPYFISGEVAKEKLVVNTPGQLRERKGVEVRTLHRVEEIVPTKRKIVVRDLMGGRLIEEPYDRLIVATGSRPKNLNLQGEDSRNVFTIKSLERSYQLENFLISEKPKHAAVIGAGYIGVEMCEALRSRGLEVTLIHNHSLPLKGLEREIRELVRERLEKNGVQFVALAETEGFVVDKSHTVRHVVTSNGSFETDLVIVAIGVLPNTELARKSGIRCGALGGILTDQRQQTNLDNIFAAGDCCEVKNIVSNRSAYIPLATIASKQGWAAGENASGGNATFRGVVHSIAVRVFGLEVVRVGLSSEEAKAAGFDVVTDSITAGSRVGMMPNSKKMTIALIADRRSHRILGANMIGEDGVALRSHTFATAIQHKISIDDFQQLDLAYSPPFTPLWDPVLVAANSIGRKM